MFNRIKATWATLRGRVYIPKPPKVIYIQRESRRGFVQLNYFEGEMLALDEEISIEEARRRWPESKVLNPPYAWWRTNYFCVNWFIRTNRWLEPIWKVVRWLRK